MMDPLQTVLQPAALRTTAFPPTSRYHGIEIKTMNSADGRAIVYLGRRFLPPVEAFALLHEHTVTEGERLDTITAQYLGDSEVFWQLCDANSVLHPEELTEPIGRRIRITLPAGIPGRTNA